MGEIADGLIDGEFDYITGEYLGEPVGYPRTLEDTSFDTLGKPTNSKELNGVLKFLRSTGKFKSVAKANKFIKTYCEEQGYEGRSRKERAKFIQKDFKKFLDYTREKTKEQQ